MKKILLSLSILLLGSAITQAQTVLTNWSFDDSSISYPSPSPGGGTGTISYLGAVTKSSGNWSSGKTGKRLGTTNYPHLSTDSSGLTGTVFATSTAGKKGIHVCYYYKLSATASQTHQMKYSTDGGSTWNTFIFSATNPTISNISSGGAYWTDVANSVVYDTGAQSKTVFALINFDLSSITAVNDNANFRFLVTPVFVPGTTAYKASSGAKNYGSGGTHGFDSVTVSYDAILPLSLKGFNASVVNNITKLTWNTFNEVNIANFELEKSTDGKTFTTVNSISSQNNTNSNYSFNDAAPKAITYYRLKINNLDGTFTYSKVISVNGKVSGGLSIYPNPAAANITVSYTKVSNNATLLVHSTDGKLLTSSKLVEGSSQTTIDVNELKTGKYILTIVDNDDKQSTVLIKK